MLLRAALLAVGGAFMAWQAVESWRAGHAAALDPGQLLLLRRIALVEASIALLALATALVALRAVRARPRRRTLTLNDLPRAPGEGPDGR